MKRIHDGHEWSGQHQALLTHCAIKVLKQHGRRNFVTIDELIAEAWIRSLRNRPPDRLHGCATIVCLIMRDALASLRIGRSRYKRLHQPVQIRSIESAEPGVIDPADRTPAPAEAVDDTAEAILHHLSPRQRQILHWRFWEEWTCQQIGDRLGVTRERARQLVNETIEAARNQFREL
jgi:RNA polymerase sigma factor (sigma-70 family)